MALLARDAFRYELQLKFSREYKRRNRVGGGIVSVRFGFYFIYFEYKNTILCSALYIKKKKKKKKKKKRLEE